MLYIINPRSGWEETFSSKEVALKCSYSIIENDEEQLVSLHGYRNPEDLIDERYSSIEEMYEDLEDYEKS